MNKITRVALIAALMLGLIAAGCGGDDDEGGDSEPLTAEAYASEVTTVLEPVGTELQEIGSVTKQAGDNAEVADNITNAEEVLDGAIADLEALEPPADAAEGHDQMIEAIANFEQAAVDFRTELEEAGDEQVTEESTQAFAQSALTFQTEFTGAIEELQSAGVTLGPAPAE